MENQMGKHENNYHMLIFIIYLTVNFINVLTNTKYVENVIITFN